MLDQTGVKDLDALRRRAEEACLDVAGLRASAAAAAKAASQARASLIQAEAALQKIQSDLDPHLLAEAKARAQRTYRLATRSATAKEETRDAAAVWMREIDRLNTSRRHALATAQVVQSALSQAHGRLEAAAREADTERIRAEVAADTCRLARARLAACQEDAFSPPTVDAPPIARDEHASAHDQAPRYPLLIELLVRGDRDALAAVARSVAEQTGRDATACLLLLQELVDAVGACAADDGFLDFDPDHPFWGRFDRSDLRSMVRALAGMGFHYQATEGWAGDRRPGSADLALALAYVGFEARGLRGLVSAAQIDSLFSGATVAADEFLGQCATGLELEQMLGFLGRRAEALDALWDDWGRVRPILMSEAAP